MPRILKLTFETEVPDTVSDEQIEEWAEYRLFLRHCMHGDNPLATAALRGLTSTLKIESLAGGQENDETVTR